MVRKAYLGSLAALASILVGAALSASAAEAAATEPTRIDFETGALEAPPSGFTAELTGKGKPVRWVVLEDPSAPAGSKVVAETSGDGTSNRFPLAVLNGFEAKDVEVSVQFKPVAGEVDQAAGLMVRLQDANNYYIARANALENNVRLYRVVDGHRQQFAGVDVPVPNGRWQTLTLRVEGERFAVALDGRELFQATDQTFSEAGRVGLWTKADSLTHFDDLVVQRLQ
jgi:Beta xylosidase C-terminal Concanavalin A-like domain